MASELAAALAKVQAELPHIAKGERANVGQYSYEYADLTAVSAAVLPLLGRHGLAFIAKPTALDGKFVLAYSLLHQSGEREDGTYPLPDKGTPQQLGGHITYARRYCLCAVTGVAPGGDDNDAAGATEVNMDRHVRTANEDPAYRRVVRAANQEPLRTADRPPAGTWDGEDHWVDQPPGQLPKPPAQNGESRRGRPKMTPAQAIAMHFQRLGVTDRTERLIKTTILAGRTEPLETTNDLDEAKQREISDLLGKCRDRAALEVLLDAKRAEVPS